MRFLLRVLVVFVVVSAALSMIRSLLAPSTPAPRTPPGPTPAGRLVKDPVCGTYVPEATALEAGGNFFCSEECRQKFVKA